MNVVDALTVTLGLDNRDYQRGVKQYRDDRKRLAEEDAKYNKTTAESQKRTVEGIRQLRNETAGFLFMLAGANSVKDFAANLLAGDAATGRLARNLGLATEEVSAWEGAVKRVGGSAADIQNALRGMASAYQSLQLMGTTGHDADLQGLGVTSKDLKNPSDALLKIAEASSRMSRPEFNARLARLGFDENTINLLAKGRGEVSRMLAEQRKLGVATEESTAAAQKFQDSMAKIEAGIMGKARPAIEKLATAFADWIEKGDNLNNLLAVTAGILGGLAVAAAAAYWPFLLLAGAIAVVAANLTKIKKAWDDLPSFFTIHAGEPPKPKDPGGESVGGFWGMLGIKRGGSHGPGQINPSGTLGDPATGGARPAAAAKGGQDIVNFFKSRGYTTAQARGITAGIMAESGGDHSVRGGYKGRALGLGQWLGDRRAEIIRRYGPNPTRQQQLEFLDWELKGGDAGGSAVRGAGSEQEALHAYVHKFMRPGAGTAGDMRRGSAWLGGGPGAMARARTAGANSTSVTHAPVTQTSTVGTVNVYTAATDASGIARDMRGELAKRGLVVQANTGLQP